MGPRDMISVIAKAHQFLTFTTPPSLQLGVAHGLAHEMDFAIALPAVQGNRDLLAAATRNRLRRPSQRRHVLSDRRIAGLTNEKDRAFCERLVREAGVALIPLSEFFSGPSRPDTYVRFAFCKQRDVIEDALARSKAHFHRG